MLLQSCVKIETRKTFSFSLSQFLFLIGGASQNRRELGNEARRVLLTYPGIVLDVEVLEEGKM